MNEVFYWRQRKKVVLDYIKQCDVCQRYKIDHQKPAGLLQPLPIPTQVWTDISMDFIDSLLSSKGKTVLLVVVDQLFKYAHFIPMSHPYTAPKVAQTFFENVSKLHGMPSSLVCDQDSTFINAFWKEHFKL